MQTSSASLKTALPGRREHHKTSSEQLLKVSQTHLSRKYPLSSGETRVLGCKREIHNSACTQTGVLYLSCSRQHCSHHMTAVFFETKTLYSLLASALASSCGRPCAPQVRSSAVHCECSIRGKSKFPQNPRENRKNAQKLLHLATRRRPKQCNF